MTTSERTEVPITKIVVTGPITKDANGKGFSVPVEFVLEDGQRITPSPFSRTRKRDVAAEVARLAASDGDPAKSMTALFRDGRFIGTRTSFYIGPRR
jgi:hypothetical protein